MCSRPLYGGQFIKFRAQLYYANIFRYTNIGTDFECCVQVYNENLEFKNFDPV